jgi:hypothetical protein
MGLFIGYFFIYPKYLESEQLKLKERKLNSDLAILKSQKSNYSSIDLLKHEKMLKEYVPKEKIKIILQNSFKNSTVKHIKSYITIFQNDYFSVSFYIKSPKEFYNWVDDLRKLNLCLTLAKDIRFQKSGSRVKVNATVVVSQIHK